MSLTSSSPLRTAALKLAGKGKPNFPCKPDKTLSKEHERELFHDSGILLEFVAARGYYTATRRSEVPEVFPEWQRRRGLVIPTYSPDDETIGYQLKPSKPITRKTGKGPRYETPAGASITLDVNPLMMGQVRTGTRRCVVTEGAKKVDALASRGIPAIGVNGVHMGAVPGTKGTVPLPCWRHVRTKGRTFTVIYDADARTNQSVQLGMQRIVAMLEKLGATVLVAYVPEVGGNPKAGIDDYLAAGGDLDTLLRSAKPYQPVNIRNERLSKDESLAREVDLLWQAWAQMPTTKGSECTERSTMREIIKDAEVQSSMSAEGFIEVNPSLRTLSSAVGISATAQAKVIKRLEEKEYLRKAPGPRKRKEAQAYILLGGREPGLHNGRKGGAGKETQAQQHMRDSLSYGESDPCVNQARGEEVPELRCSKTVPVWERVGNRWQVVDVDFLFRLGKKRGEILRYLVVVGGVATIGDIMQRFAGPKTRVRDFKRDCLAHLEGFRMQKTKKVDAETFEEVNAEQIDLGPPIIEMEGDIVSLAPEWRANLEIVRTLGREQEDERIQREKIARQRERFHNPPPKAEPTPDMPTPGQVREILRGTEERDEQSRIAEQRSKAGTTVETFIYDTLSMLGHVRLGLLREVWRDRGGNPSDVWRAVQRMQCKLKRLPHHDNALFVFPATQSENREPAEVVSIQRKPSKNLPEPEPEESEKWKSHSLDCGCDDCLYPEPKYVKPYVGSGVMA